MSENDMLKIEVTQRLKRCLEYAKDAIKNLPPGEQRQITEAALDYIDKAFKGEPQPEVEMPCMPGILLIP